jgi:hypothetical protein
MTYETIESLAVMTFHSNMLLTLWADLQTSVSAWLIGESDWSPWNWILALEYQYQKVRILRIRNKIDTAKTTFFLMLRRPWNVDCYRAGQDTQNTERSCVHATGSYRLSLESLRTLFFQHFILRSVPRSPTRVLAFRLPKRAHARTLVLIVTFE